MPESYGNLHGRSQSIKNEGPIINKNPATFKSTLGSQQPSPKRGVAYGTTDSNGEPISVKGHLHDLEVSLFVIDLWFRIS